MANYLGLDFATQLWKLLLLTELPLPVLSSLKPDISFVIYKFHFVVRSLPGGQATVEMGWGYLRKQLREFTLNTQQDLESERAALMTRCIMAEEQLARLQHYIDTNLKR